MKDKYLFYRQILKFYFILNISIFILIIDIADVASQNPEWVNYKRGNWIEAIAEEGQFLWIASRVGLYRLDKLTGEKELFTSASGLPGSLPLSIAIDSNGIKWIGTGYGLAKFDGTNWQYFHTGNSALLSDFIRTLLVDINNNIWMGTGNGLAKFDGEVWTIYPGEDFNLPEWDLVRDLTQDKWGNIWALYGSQSKKGLLIRLNDETWHTYDIPPPRHGSDYWYNYGDIEADNYGNIWVAVERHNGDGGALMRFNGTDWDIYQKHNSGLKDNNIFSVELDDEGNVWVGTWSGIAKFDGDTWLNFDEENTKLEMWRVTTIYIDQGKVKWFGTGDLGLIRFNENSWTVYPLHTKPEYWGGYKVIADKSGDIWFVGESILTKYDGNEWTVFDLPDTLNINQFWIDMVFDDKNRLWISTFEKLGYFDGTDWNLFTDSLAYQLDWGPGFICIGSENTIWISSDFGLAEYNYSTNDLKTHKFYDNRFYERFEQTSLVFDSQNIWLGTRDGLIKFDGEQYTVYDTSNSELNESHVTCLALSADTMLWIGTWQGLNSFDGHYWQVHQDLNNAIKQDRDIAPIEAIEIGVEGDIWLSTYDGLFRYNGQEWTNYNTRNSGLTGYLSEDLAIDKDGNLWIPFNGGFDIFREGGVVGEFQDYREEPYSIQISHIPDEPLTYNVYPNPFNQYTKIRFDLNRPSLVNITISDILGRVVDNLLDTFRPAGSHTTVFNGSGNASGVYILRIAVNGKYSSKKMLLLK
jgi:ligand-binding sensor domain-containing protein